MLLSNNATIMYSKEMKAKQCFDVRFIQWRQTRERLCEPNEPPVSCNNVKTRELTSLHRGRETTTEAHQQFDPPRVQQLDSAVDVTWYRWWDPNNTKGAFRRDAVRHGARKMTASAARRVNTHWNQCYHFGVSSPSLNAP